MEREYQSICTALRSLREEAGYTRQELGTFFGVGEENVGDWESGVREPTISECLILSRLYGVALDEMFAGFDAQKLIPEAYREEFGCKVYANHMAKRWYL